MIRNHNKIRTRSTRCADYARDRTVRKLTDPFGKETNYVNDKVGRTTDVTGTTFASQSTTIDNKTYRAFGATKSITYGTSLVMTQTFDSRLFFDKSINRRDACTRSGGFTAPLILSGDFPFEA